MAANRLRSLFTAFFFAAGAGGVLAGCAEGFDEEELLSDDGDGQIEDEIVAERQLFGNELPDKTLALTFDDGPGARTRELADYLAAEGIQAAFFINGSKVPGRQSVVEAIVARGHLLANHTQNHISLRSLSSARVVSEVAQTDAIIAAAQPNGPFVIRAPFGSWNGATAAAINGSGMRKYVGSVFWDVGGAMTSKYAADWACWGRSVSVTACGEGYLNEIRAKRKGIVLLHDIHGRTVDMTKWMIPKLRAEGYKFVPLETVPSVRRAIGAVSTPTTPSTPSQPGVISGCQSASLGRTVPNDACVQSISDRRWYRCASGEWASVSPTDTRCVSTHPLAN